MCVRRYLFGVDYSEVLVASGISQSFDSSSLNAVCRFSIRYLIIFQIMLQRVQCQLFIVKQCVCSLYLLLSFYVSSFFSFPLYMVYIHTIYSLALYDNRGIFKV